MIHSSRRCNSHGNFIWRVPDILCSTKLVSNKMASAIYWLQHVNSSYVLVLPSALHQKARKLSQEIWIGMFYFLNIDLFWAKWNFDNDTSNLVPSMKNSKTERNLILARDEYEAHEEGSHDWQKCKSTNTSDTIVISFKWVKSSISC